MKSEDPNQIQLHRDIKSDFFPPFLAKASNQIGCFIKFLFWSFLQIFKLDRVQGVVYRIQRHTKSKQNFMSAHELMIVIQSRNRFSYQPQVGYFLHF